MNILVEKIINKYIDAGKKVLDDYKRNKQWERFLSDAGLDIASHKDADISGEMAYILSEDNMREIAQKIKLNNGYELIDKLQDEVSHLMQKYDIPCDVIRSINQDLKDRVTNYIKKNDPTLYTQIYDNDWRKEQKQELGVINQKVTDIQSISSDTKSKRKIYSVEQVNNSFIEGNKFGLDLTFFTNDDDEFNDIFKTQLHNEEIYIKCQCKEEGLFIALNVIKDLQDDREILIVKTIDDWEYLRADKTISGKILFPWFYSEEILPIIKNTNIFVLGGGEAIVGKNPINLRKRTKESIRHALQKAEIDNDEIFRLVESTHGFYIPLKKKISRGTDNRIPRWAKNPSKSVLTALLCNSWTDMEGDKYIISELAGCDYDDFVNEVLSYRNDEEPLVIRMGYRGNTKYTLACAENAWDYLDDYVSFTDRIWKNYEDVLELAISDYDKVNSLEIYERAVRFLGEKTDFSYDIKYGMLDSLIMKAFYKLNNENQLSIDAFVDRVMEDINSSQRWVYVTKFIDKLCEASPKAIMKRLEDELDSPSGLIEAFVDGKEDIDYGNVSFYSFLWKVSQLLYLKEYAHRFCIWLFELDNKLLGSKASEYCENIIEDVLCPWYQMFAVSPEGRKSLVPELIKLNRNSWNILFELLPGRKNSISPGENKPKYRDIVEVPVLKNEDVIALYKFYTETCISEANLDENRWSKLLKVTSAFNDSMASPIIKELKRVLVSMDDDKKVFIDCAIRKCIYEHRYYESSAWALNEESIRELEELLNSISYTEKEYEYFYLFGSIYNFPILNPVSNDNDNSYKENELLVKKEIKDKINEFKRKGLDVQRLIALCGDKCPELGYILGVCYSEDGFISDIYKTLIKNSDLKNTRDYVRYACKNDERQIKKAIAVSKKLNLPSEEVAKIYALQVISSVESSLIKKEDDEEILRFYWSEPLDYNCNPEIIRWLLDSCALYGYLYRYVDILWRNYGKYNCEELVLLLENVIHIELPTSDGMIGFQLEQILHKVQEEAHEDYYGRIARIEIHFIRFLKWEKMACSRMLMAKSPELYLYIVNRAYNNDYGDNNVGAGKEEGNNYYYAFTKMRICPGNINGHVDKLILEKWLEEFDDGLKKQKQWRLRGHLLGRLFALSPVGDDGLMPCEEIRDIIERKCFSEELASSYCVEIFNSRGGYCPSAGKEEKRIANDYKRNADGIRDIYPKTASLYDDLADQYYYEADISRKRAEYEE